MKIITTAVFSFLIIILSAGPMFHIIREALIENIIEMRYEFHHAYTGEDGFEDIINAQELIIDNINIKIIEEEIGLKAPLTPWDIDENVLPGGIVKIHLLLNDKEITNPDKVKLLS
ncbi:hypothetical protein, partial [Metabacillus fastidiosus]|uniref:hypothetical protein n=1 Tax=Metabacillus fastidiosus TaxID=1458 RepID=UPI003D28D665